LGEHLGFSRLVDGAGGQFAVSAGRGERDCLAVLPLARSPARASALARTTSGSRGSGGRASCQGRSRRTLGRWIRICCTVSHLPGQPPIPWGRWRMGSLEAEDIRDTRAGLDSWTRASLRPAGGQPPPVILDDGDVVRAADASVKQSLGVQQAPQRLGAVGGAELAHDVGHVLFDRVERHHQVVGWGPARPRWPGSSGNGTDSRLRGASPERACWVECRGAAIPHPKVLPCRPGGGVRGSGPGRVRGLRPRCGWPRRACPGRGSRAF